MIRVNGLPWVEDAYTLQGGATKSSYQLGT